jgi:hypothetical protein
MTFSRHPLVLIVPLATLVLALRLGQQDPSDKLLSVYFHNVEVRDALGSLFNSMGVSYSISPDVRGRVNMNLSGTTFETALQNICKQVNATYRANAIYPIVHRQWRLPLKVADDADSRWVYNELGACQKADLCRDHAKDELVYGLHLKGELSPTTHETVLECWEAVESLQLIIERKENPELPKLGLPSLSHSQVSDHLDRISWILKRLKIECAQLGDPEPVWQARIGALKGRSQKTYDR